MPVNANKLDDCCRQIGNSSKPNEAPLYREPLLFLACDDRNKRGQIAGKTRVISDGQVVESGRSPDYNAGTWFKPRQVLVSDANSFFDELKISAAKNTEFTTLSIVSGEMRIATAMQHAGDDKRLLAAARRLRPDAAAQAAVQLIPLPSRIRKLHHVDRNKGEDPHVDLLPRRGLCIDLDDTQLSALLGDGVDIHADLSGSIPLAIKRLPDWIKDGPMSIQVSYSTSKLGAHDLRVHVFFWTDRPVDVRLFKKWIETYNHRFPEIRKPDRHHAKTGSLIKGKPALCDPTVYDVTHPIYLAAKLIDELGNPTSDPIPQRWFRFNMDKPHSVLPSDDEMRSDIAAVADKQRETQQTAARQQLLAAPSGAPVTRQSIRQTIGMAGEASSAIFARMGRGSFDECLQEGTTALVRENPKCIHDPLLHNSLLGEVQQAVLSADDGSSEAKLQENLKKAERLLNGAIDFRRSGYEAWKVHRDAGVARTVKQGDEVSLVVATKQLDELLTDFFDKADAERLECKAREYRYPADWLGFDDDADKSAYETSQKLWLGSAAFNAMISNAALHNERLKQPNTYVVAVETGGGKSYQTLSKIVERADLTKERVIVYCVNHKDARQKLKDIDPHVDVVHVGSIQHVASDAEHGLCSLDAEHPLWKEWETLQDKGASKSETICKLCSVREAGNCDYWSQEAALKRPGIKLVQHAALRTPPKGLWPKRNGSDLDDFAPTYCVVFDEDFSNALTTETKLSWTRTADTSSLKPIEKWAYSVIKQIGDHGEQALLPGYRSIAQDFASRIDAARSNYSAACDAANRALGDAISKGDKDTLNFNWPATELAERERAKTVLELAELISDQLEQGRYGPLRGFGVEVIAGDNEHDRDRYHLTLRYRQPMPGRFGGQFGLPTLVLDATMTEWMAERILMQREAWCGTHEVLDEYGQPTGEYEAAEGLTAPRAPLAPFCAGAGAKGFLYSRIRIEKPFARLVGVWNAETSKAKLKVAELDLKKRHQANHKAEQLLRKVRLICESYGDKPVGVFAHKPFRAYCEAHAVLPDNIIWGHHGIGTALNYWEDVAALIIIGKNELAPERRVGDGGGNAIDDANSFFALDWELEPLVVTQAHIQHPVELTDGGTQDVPQRIYTDVRVEARRRQTTNAALEQTVGRARMTRRKDHNPVDVIVLADEALALPYAETVNGEMLRDVSPFDFAAVRGLVPQTSKQVADLHSLLADIYPDHTAIKNELDRLKSVNSGSVEIRSNRIIRLINRELSDFDASLGLVLWQGYFLNQKQKRTVKLAFWAPVDDTLAEEAQQRLADIRGFQIATPTKRKPNQIARERVAGCNLYGCPVQPEPIDHAAAAANTAPTHQLQGAAAVVVEPADDWQWGLNPIYDHLIWTDGQWVCPCDPDFDPEQVAFEERLALQESAGDYCVSLVALPEF